MSTDHDVPLTLLPIYIVHTDGRYVSGALYSTLLSSTTGAIVDYICAIRGMLGIAYTRLMCGNKQSNA